MNGLFDIHMHINDPMYKESGIETKSIIEAAKKAGVVGMCCSGFDIESSKQAVKYAVKYKEVYASVGIHPDKAEIYKNEDIYELELLCYGDKVIGIGEIGLDYHFDINKEKQIKLFQDQLDIAIKHNLPVILHIRDFEDSDQAYLDALEILKAKKINKGIVHCFTKEYKIGKMFIDQGFYLSIGGIVTFPTAIDLVNSVEKTSINNIVLETDAPYLAPIPNRGKINCPEYIKHTAQKIADIKKMNINDVINATTKNIIKIFDIK